MHSSAHADTQSGFHNYYIEFHLWFVYISMNTGFQEEYSSTTAVDLIQ